LSGATSRPYQPFQPEYIRAQQPFVVPIIEAAPVNTSFSEEPQQTRTIDFQRPIYLQPPTHITIDPLTVIALTGVVLGFFGLLAILAYSRR